MYPIHWQGVNFRGSPSKIKKSLLSTHHNLSTKTFLKKKNNGLAIILLEGIWTFTMEHFTLKFIVQKLWCCENIHIWCSAKTFYAQIASSHQWDCWLVGLMIQAKLHFWWCYNIFADILFVGCDMRLGDTGDIAISESSKCIDLLSANSSSVYFFSTEDKGTKFKNQDVANAYWNLAFAYRNWILK